MEPWHKYVVYNIIVENRELYFEALINMETKWIFQLCLEKRPFRDVLGIIFHVFPLICLQSSLCQPKILLALIKKQWSLGFSACESYERFSLAAQLTKSYPNIVQIKFKKCVCLAKWNKKNMLGKKKSNYTILSNTVCYFYDNGIFWSELI